MVLREHCLYLIGHTDPTFTMRVYQQVLDMGGSAPEQLEQLLGCAVDEACTMLSGRDVWTTQRTLGPEKPSWGHVAMSPPEGRKPLLERIPG